MPFVQILTVERGAMIVRHVRNRAVPIEVEDRRQMLVRRRCSSCEVQVSQGGGPPFYWSRFCPAVPEPAQPASKLCLAETSDTPTAAELGLDDAMRPIRAFLSRHPCVDFSTAFFVYVSVNPPHLPTGVPANTASLPPKLVLNR